MDSDMDEDDLVIAEDLQLCASTPPLSCHYCSIRQALHRDAFKRRYNCSHFLCFFCSRSDTCPVKGCMASPAPVAASAPTNPLQVPVMMVLVGPVTCPMCDSKDLFINLNDFNMHLTLVHKVAQQHLSKFYCGSK